jgi:hypothetical protein
MAAGTSMTDEYLQQADELVQLLDNCPPEVFTWRASALRLTIAEIIGHLADAELLAAVRLRQMIAQDRPHLYRCDQELWAQRLGYSRQDLEGTALLFTTLRRTSGALLGQLAYEDWGRTGRHEGEGEISLFQLIERAIAETARRLDQVRAVAAEYAAQTNGHGAVPAPLEEKQAEPTAGAAKFYALAILAGLTILSVGFFMQSRPIYILGVIVSAVGVLLVMFITWTAGKQT